MRKSIAFTAVAGLAIIAGASAATAMNGPMSFTPIAESAYAQESTTWTEPLKAPLGFKQELVRDETKLDVFPGQDDLTDMNTVNENGRQAGRYLYSTTEVGTNGAVTIADLKAGNKSRVLVQFVNGVLQTTDADGTVRTLNSNSITVQDFRRLDGIRWTPWGSLLFAEETAGGRVFEIKFAENDPTKVEAVLQRSQLGILRHEGIEALPNGTVYVIDELNGGSIFKFVPKRRGDLSEGQLYALKVANLTDAQQKWDAAKFDEKVGAFSWVALDMNQVVIDADAAANAVNATEFGRPEDVEFIGNTLYVANTSENRVVAINESTNVLSSFVQAGKNTPVEDQKATPKVTGFAKPDNLAQGPDGRLWIVEDNDFSDIWVADRDRNNDGAADKVELFASLKDKGAEITGIYFGKDPKTLFFNVQHPDKDLADGTWKISKRSMWR